MDMDAKGLYTRVDSKDQVQTLSGKFANGEFQKFVKLVAESVPSAYHSWGVVAVALEKLAQMIYDRGESLHEYGAFEISPEGIVRVNEKAVVGDYMQVKEERVLQDLKVLGVGGSEARIYSYMGAQVVNVDPRLTRYAGGNLREIGLALDEKIKELIKNQHGTFDLVMTCRVLHEGSGVTVPDIGINYQDEGLHGVRLVELVHELTREGGFSVHNGSLAKKVLDLAEIDGEVEYHPHGDGDYQSVWVVKK